MEHQGGAADREQCSRALKLRSLTSALLELTEEFETGLDGSVRDIFADWAKHRFPDLKPRTVEEYNRGLDHFGRHLGDLAVRELTRAHIQAAMDACTRGSRSSFFSVIAACLNWADRNGWPGVARALPTRRPMSRPRNFHFDDQQWRAFWTAVCAARVCPGRCRPVAMPQTIDAIAVGALTAMRLGELCSLRWDEVSLSGRVIWLFDTKTGNRSVALPLLAAELIARQPRQPGNKYVWGRPGPLLWRLGESGVSSAYRRIVRSFGQDGLEHPENCFHSLRHSWASTALRRGVPMEIVRRQLGHSTVHMTNRYAHLGDAALRAHVDDVESAILDGSRVELDLALGLGGAK